MKLAITKSNTRRVSTAPAVAINHIPSNAIGGVRVSGVIFLIAQLAVRLRCDSNGQISQRCGNAR